VEIMTLRVNGIVHDRGQLLTKTHSSAVARSCMAQVTWPGQWLAIVAARGVRGRGRSDQSTCHRITVSQMSSSACRAARWPAWTAPSIYPLHALAVSVAAHLIGPIGSLSAAPKWSRPHGPVFEL
jgi:hypothetical protein